MLSALTFGLLPLVATATIGTERAGRGFWLQALCLTLLAAGTAGAADSAGGVDTTRPWFPGLREVLFVWAPLGFVGLLGWSWRHARAL